MHLQLSAFLSSTFHFSFFNACLSFPNSQLFNAAFLSHAALSIFTHKDFQHLTVPVFFIYPPPPLSLIFSGLSLVLNRQISAGTVAVNTAAPQSLLTHYLSSKERQRRKCSPRSPSFFLSILNDTAAPN